MRTTKSREMVIPARVITAFAALLESLFARYKCILLLLRYIPRKETILTTELALPWHNIHW